MAYIDVTPTANSLRVKIYGLDASYGKKDRVCTWLLNGRKKGNVTLGANITSGGTYTFRNLSPGTTYNIEASITAPGWTIVVSIKGTGTTLKVSVKAWSWSRSNGEATTAQTQAAYSAITSRGNLSDFSYFVWNDLVNKVQEVLKAKGEGWLDRYGSYGSTLMSSGDRELTAARFNSLRFNIGYRVSTGISEVSRGDIVYGRYFTTLADCLNDWIASI